MAPPTGFRADLPIVFPDRPDVNPDYADRDLHSSRTGAGVPERNQIANE
jgi:hypothetical protein